MRATKVTRALHNLVHVLSTYVVICMLKKYDDTRIVLSRAKRYKTGESPAVAEVAWPV